MKITIIVILFLGSTFARNVIQQNIAAEGPKCPIDDPLVRNGPLPINYSFDPLFKLDVGSDASVIFEGLSTLHYEINVSALLLTVDFEYNLDLVSGNATYTAAGYIDASPISEETIPRGDISGFGFGEISATGIHVKGRGQLFVNFDTNKFIFRTLNLEVLKFDSLAIDLGNDVTIGGEAVNWAEFSANIKQNFDMEWLQHRDELTEKIRIAINKRIEETVDPCIGIGCIPVDPPFDPECKPVHLQ